LNFIESTIGLLKLDANSVDGIAAIAAQTISATATIVPGRDDMGFAEPRGMAVGPERPPLITTRR
jgi:hypothetical protein